MVAHTRMAYTGIVYFYSDLVRFRWFDLNVLDGEVFACFPSYGGLQNVSHLLPCLRCWVLWRTLQVMVYPMKNQQMTHGLKGVYLADLSSGI